LKFWDSSAIASVLLKERLGTRLEEMLRRDETMVTWWGTVVECTAALARARRGGRITVSGEGEASRELDELSANWHEVTPWPEVRAQAQRLVRIHRLGAADALQLGAAIVWTGHAGEGEFVSLDDRLREAARLEGFDVVPGKID